MSPITTHVLDTASGRPARQVAVVLAVKTTRGWKALGNGKTNADGRIAKLLPSGARLTPGTYRMTFETGDYFRSLGSVGFYPEVTIHFEVRDPSQHYHVPLLLSPFGYSTYRGS
jgi:5-hydroxyisourate hydrolase